MCDILIEKGLIFVGLDVIGDYFIEINVISFICICEIDVGVGINIVGLLLDVVEFKLKERN